jgi:hypothetical protein
MKLLRNQKSLAAFGGLLVVPALILCVSGLLKFNVSYWLIHPTLVIGGLVCGLAINLLAVTHFQAHLQNGNLVGALSIKLRGSLMNLCVVALSLCLLGTIALCLFVENFQPR